MANIAAVLEKLKSTDFKGMMDKVNSALFGPTEIIGVDVGSYAVKVAIVKSERKGIQLKAWGYLPIQAKPDASPEERKKQTVNAIKAFMIEKGVQTKCAATSISGNAVIVRYVRFPLLTKSELRATLGTEAEPFIPFDIKDVQLSFHILNEVVEAGQKKMETVLVAAKKDAVQSRVEILEEAGLKPVIIDVDSFTFENILEKQPFESEGPGASLYLNIGHMVTNLSIMEGTVTRVVRDVFISGNTFTKAIAKALQCDYAKAEEAKRTHGILIDPEEKERALQEGNRDALGVSQSVLAVLKDLVAEVHRSVDFYLSQGPERSIARIMLSGGSARLKNIVKYLAAELKVPVSVFNPTTFLSETPLDLPESLAPSLSVAIGLALRTNKDWS